MIVFGVAVASQDKYERIALPSIRRAAEADSLIITRHGFPSIQEPYNQILDEASRLAGLEAVVLLHEDAEIVDPEFCALVRRGFAEPSVGAIGPIGGRCVSSIAWWKPGPALGRVRAPNVIVGDVMRGELDIGWYDVEALDGLMLCVSPWVARRVRFDMRFAPMFHGYDVDFSFAVRAAGKRCLVAPVDVTHYGVWKPSQSQRWTEASLAWERKWGARREERRSSHVAWA